MVASSVVVRVETATYRLPERSSAQTITKIFNFKMFLQLPVLTSSEGARNGTGARAYLVGAVIYAIALADKLY